MKAASVRARDVCFAQGKELGRAQPRDRIRTSLGGGASRLSWKSGR